MIGIEELLFGNPEMAQSFLGAFFSALGGLASAFGGGQDNSINAQAQVQAQKLQSATQKANTAAQLQQRASEQNITSVENQAQLQQQALDNLVRGFGSAFLGGNRRINF